MPVTLENIKKPTEQDLIDLNKIYLDYPGELRWTALEKELEKSPAITLYGARFNARLLAAISFTEYENHIELNHLCVRKVTRQRHVARDLLRLSMAQAPAKKLIFNSCLEDEGLTQLLLQAGFSQNESQFIYTV